MQERGIKKVLWIAYKLVSLHYQKQHLVADNVGFMCCELLTN